jgi:serine/threonine protein kinase/Tfp pilus assembly protein PilF
MGKVYKAQDTDLKEKVAIKLLKPEIAADKKTIERFRNELKFARKIRHKNVCQMYDLNKEKGAHYITMEYVDGKDLKSMIRMMGQLSSGKTISIAKQVCDGLAEAHRLGVVHRDLKPQNIMVDEEGNARIMDFGIARSIKEKGITAAGVMIGTPEYMSPEQVEGKEVDQRSDIYSLGVILYEMVTGRVPFEGDTPFTIGVKHKSEEPKDPKELNTQLPEDLNLVILRCLEKDKEKRYQSAGEVRAELMKIEEGIPSTERVVPKKKPTTAKDITVTFSLRKFLIPALVIIAVVIAAVVIWKRLPRKEAVPLPPSKPSVAVLPFEDLSPEKDQESFCDGLVNSIINALSNIDDLSVRARGSSFLFKDKQRNLQEIAEKLNVETVLEGSVQKMGERLRITAQLVNTADESVLWSEIYNRGQGDVFAIQDEITLAVADKLRIELLGEEKTKLIKRYTEDIEAFNLYSKGLFYLNKRTGENLKKAIQYFEKAVEKDSGYALAYARLSESQNLITDYISFPPKEVYLQGLKARESALKALEIDNTLAEAYTSLGSIKWKYDWDWDGAEQELLRAIELNPGNANAHFVYAYLLMLMARFEEAITEMKLALELDPLSLIINRNLGQLFYRARQYDKAIEALQKTLQMDPDFSVTHFYLGSTYLQKSFYKEALAEFQKEKDISKRQALDPEAMIIATNALMGEREEALQILNDFMEISKDAYVSPYFFAYIHVALGEKDSTFEWLEKAYNERDIYMRWLKVDPLFDSIRSDPRFKALLKKMNLE